MGYTYINPPIYGFKIPLSEGALRDGKRKLRREVVPVRLLPLSSLPREAIKIRDLGERKHQNKKGSMDFHKRLLAVLNYGLRLEQPGVELYYEKGGPTKRPPIKTFEMLPPGAGDRLNLMNLMIEEWHYHYGPAETFTSSQTQGMLDFLATVISRDSAMVDMITLA